MVAAADQLLTVADIVALKKLGVADLSDVPIFATGVHNREDDPKEYTNTDLADMVRNFNALSAGSAPLLAVPIGIGHEEDQSWVDDTGLPAVGLIKRLWFTPDDGILHASFNDIPRLFAEALDQGVYFNLSAEIYDEPPEGCPGTGCTLRRVSLLGAEQPAVKRLLRVPPVEWRRKRFTEHRTRRRVRCKRITPRTARGSYWTFSEVVMDRKALEEKLVALGWTQTAVDLLANLPDEDFAALVTELLSAAAGVAPTDSGTPAGGAAEVSAPPAREQMIADLVAVGEDPTMLEGLSDADLLALWTQKVGGQSEHSEGEPVTTTVTPPVVTPAPTPALTPAQFAELKTGLTQAQADLQKVRRDNALLSAHQKREFAESARRAQAERMHSIKSYCERWVRDAYVLPSEVDAKSTVPNFYHQLVNADGVKVRKYGEKQLSDFDALVAQTEARGAGYVKRFFSEKITADPAATSKYDEARKAAGERAKALRGASSADEITKRLGGLQSPSVR
jgi:hypothetical protein